MQGFFFLVCVFTDNLQARGQANLKFSNIPTSRKLQKDVMEISKTL